jgi:hypothetical protein
VTARLASSTVPSAICPASPDHTFTVQRRVSSANVASVVGSAGYRSSQSATFGWRRKSAVARASSSAGPRSGGVNGVSTRSPSAS